MGCSTGWRVYAKCQVPWRNKKGQFGASFLPTCMFDKRLPLPADRSGLSLTAEKLDFWTGLFLSFTLIYGLSFCQTNYQQCTWCITLLDHHNLASPQDRAFFLLAMYVHKYFCSDNSVGCLNKNMYIFNRALSYITNNSIIMYSFHILFIIEMINDHHQFKQITHRHLIRTL